MIHRSFLYVFVTLLTGIVGRAGVKKDQKSHSRGQPTRCSHFILKHLLSATTLALAAFVIYLFDLSVNLLSTISGWSVSDYRSHRKNWSTLLVHNFGAQLSTRSNALVDFFSFLS